MKKRSLKLRKEKALAFFWEQLPPSQLVEDST